jgi:branched-chain amino acid aminotransferase
VLVTRGVGDLSYDPASCPVPSIVVIAKPQIDPAPDVYERGVNVAIVSIVRNHPGTVNPVIKSNNLLNNALAMQEAVRAGAFEGVMRNYRGELSECTTANIFVVRRGTALTPPLDAGLLPGITREFLFEVGRVVGIPVEEVTLRDADLLEADEAFLTSTTREIVPITRVNGRSVSSGHPGAVTRALLAEFRRQAQALTAGVPALKTPQA